MRNCCKAVLILAAFLIFAAPQAGANSGNHHWFKNVFHLQQKTPKHPERGSDKLLARQEKAKDRSARMRERAAEQHTTPKAAKTSTQSK